MAWGFVLLLAAATALFLWRSLRLDRAAVQMMVAALLIGLAGYAWTGRPTLAGSPKAPPGQRVLPDSPFAALRKSLLGQFDSSDAWLTVAEGYQRRGDTAAGAQLIKSALRQDPNNFKLWIGLGNALVLHADNQITPAAELAFNRAAVLAPQHPGPRFFNGLALLQGGDLEGAGRHWRQLLASAPADAEWRPFVAERVEVLDQIRNLAEQGRFPVPPGGQSPR